MKSNILYYPHYTAAHTHPKFKMLRVKYGWEGEGKFWALNNMIGLAENCKLDLSRKFVVADILELFKFNQEQFNEFIDYLEKECELIEREGNCITTEIVQETFTQAEVKREDSRSRYRKKKDDPESIITPETKILDAENGNLGESDSLIKANQKKQEQSTSKQKETLMENPFFGFDKHIPTNGQYSQFKPRDFNDDIELKKSIRAIVIHFTNFPFTENLLNNLFDKMTTLKDYTYVSREMSFKIFYDIYSNLTALGNETKQEIRNPTGYPIKVIERRISDKNSDMIKKLDQKKRSVKQNGESPTKVDSIADAINKNSKGPLFTKFDDYDDAKQTETVEVNNDDAGLPV